MKIPAGVIKMYVRTFSIISFKSSLILHEKIITKILIQDSTKNTEKQWLVFWMEINTNS